MKLALFYREDDKIENFWFFSNLLFKISSLVKKSNNQNSSCSLLIIIALFFSRLQLLNAVGNVRKTLTLPGDLNGLQINGNILLDFFLLINIFADRLFAGKFISQLVEKFLLNPWEFFR